MNDLEWLVDEPSDVVVSGLMLREFGPGVDESIYGFTARQVGEYSEAAYSWPGGSGPQYAWTRLRSAEFQRCGFFVSEG